MVLNPKGTACWLVENTSLTFEQIADFCNLHYMEIEAIANEDIKIAPQDPIQSHQLTQEEIQRCENDSNAKLVLNSLISDLTNGAKKKKKYKFLVKRNLIPCAALYLVIKYPEISDVQISKLIGTTKNTVAKIRDGSYKGLSGITPKDPVLAGFCTKKALDELLESLNIKVQQ